MMGFASLNPSYTISSLRAKRSNPEACARAGLLRRCAPRNDDSLRSSQHVARRMSCALAKPIKQSRGPMMGFASLNPSYEAGDPSRLGASSYHTQLLPQAPKRRFPVADGGLTVEAHGRIPGAVGARDEPTEIGRERQQQRHGLAHGAGEMRDRGVDADD